MRDRIVELTTNLHRGDYKFAETLSEIVLVIGVFALIVGIILILGTLNRKKNFKKLTKTLNFIVFLAITIFFLIVLYQSEVQDLKYAYHADWITSCHYVSTSAYIIPILNGLAKIVFPIAIGSLVIHLVYKSGKRH